MMNEDDDSAGFRIAVVLAEKEEPNDIDWSTLIISNEITYSKHIFIAEHWLMNFSFSEKYSAKRQKTTVATNKEENDDDDDFF